MTYRGVVKNGAIVLEGEMPAEGTVVEVRAVSPKSGEAVNLRDLEAFGIWKDRKDMPQDSVEAVQWLREQARLRREQRD